jgi:DNA-binding MarR family transcriptional regulator
LSAQASQTPQIPLRNAEQRVFVGLVRAHVATTRLLNAGLETRHGLTLNDYEVLLHLAHAPDRMMRRVDLAQSVLLTPSGITRLLEGLEREGYVDRAKCGTDGRVSYARLTDAGHAKLKEASVTHLDEIRTHFADRFSPEELDALKELLARLELDSPEGAPDCTP